MRGRKSTQRERLVSSVLAIVDRDGYASANVSRIITEAGVSRPTFYEYFKDKDDCLLAALNDVHERLIVNVARAVDERPPEVALQASLAAIVEFASAEPIAALFLTSRAMGAGPVALDARDDGIARIAQIIFDAYAQVPRSAPLPDVSPRVLVGGLYRLLASRLRRGEPGLRRMIDDVDAWVTSYAQPPGERRWQSLVPAPTGRAPRVRATLTAPRPAPAHDASTSHAPASHRQRILYAAAQLAETKGYNATTISDITHLAGVDGRAFYAAFSDKQETFMAVHELGVQQVMSATAGAFFTGASWPERIWAAGRAFTEFLDDNPMIAFVGFVEAYAVGPGAVQRVEDSHTTFTIFLQEGYQHKPQRAPPSRVAMEATITSIFEIVYLSARNGPERRVSEMLGAVAFLALAPFMGAKRASCFIDGRWRDYRRDDRSPRAIATSNWKAT
jgi:AcrR family transcriptional regulator